MQDFGNTARGFTAVLSLVSNSAIGELTAYVAFETTPASTNRDFWTQNLPANEWPMVPGRLVHAGFFPPMVDAFYNHVERDRFHRAMVQYHHALQEWDFGTEIAALNHIWIGMEALTKLVRAKLQRDLGIGEHELARQYLPDKQPREDGKYNLSNLDAEIRLRHLFQGDQQIHKWAREASDSHEHSFHPLWKVRDHAVKAADASLKYLRAAIFEYSGVDTEYQTVLLDSYFADPHINKAQFGLQGVLRGPAAQLDLIDSFPDIQLHQDMLHFGMDTIGDAKVGFRTAIQKGQLPEGVEFYPDSPEIVALPGTVGDTNLVISGSQDGLANAESQMSWQSEMRNGRNILSIAHMELVQAAMTAQRLEVVSVDEKYEYKAVHVDGQAANLGRQSLTDIYLRYQAELAEDGLELLCIIPSTPDESVILVCRTDAGATEPAE